jgi:hypothetical protein
MSPILLPLYLASFFVIGLLSFFAHQNRKAGWVKERNTIVEDLLALQMYWDDAESTEVSGYATHSGVCAAPINAPDPTSAEVMEFTRQLAVISQMMGEPTRPEKKMDSEAVKYADRS